MNKEDVKISFVFIVLALLVVGPSLLLLMQPYLEARAFNKFTSGPKATYWDALWSELRVMPK
jgi:hypothetical protein